MKRIYFKNAQGKKVYLNVEDDVAEAEQQTRHDIWNSDAKEKYHCTSLDNIKDNGYEFADVCLSAEEIHIAEDNKTERDVLLEKLKLLLPKLTPLQQSTVYKYFYLKMTMPEIAEEEGVTKQTVAERLEGIYKKLRKLFEKI